MLARTDPFREFDRLAERAVGARARPAMMPLDAYRDDDRFVVHFDVPGVAPSAVDVTVERNVLTVTAERRWPANDHQHVLASERPQGMFRRQLFLGDGLDLERLEARYDNGVLTIAIPVVEQAKPRKVPISANGNRAAITAGASAAG